MIIGKDFVILHTPKTGVMFRHWVAEQYTCRCLCPAWLQRMKVTKEYIFFSIKVCSRETKGTANFRDSHIKYYPKIALYKFFVWQNHHPELIHSVLWDPWRVGGWGECKVHILRDREILAVLRNPYRQAISSFQYTRMRRGKTQKLKNFADHLRRGSLQRTVRQIQKKFGVEHTDYSIGRLSSEFILECFKDPAKIFAMSAEEFDEYCISDDYKKDMYPIKFFRTETMNRQLCEYLKSKPYLDSQIIDEIFKEAEPKNVSKKREDAVWDDETKTYFEKTEKFYIRMVKELAPLPEDDF